MQYFLFDSIVEKTQYPSGEFHTRLKFEPADGSVIEASVFDFNDLCSVVAIDKTIKRKGKSVKWFIPFFPFARDDRRNTELDSFELGLAMSLVKDLDLKIVDPHSYTLCEIPHISSDDVQKFLGEKFSLFGKFDYNVIPDLGAAKKNKNTFSCQDTLQGMKERNPKTGKLTGFGLMEDVIMEGSSIIMDDICDGGGTFMGLASVLLGKGAEEISLLVTHGLFTKGTGKLLEIFKDIYCMSNNETEGVKTATWKELYERHEK